MGCYGHEKSTQRSTCELQNTPRDEGTPRWTAEECYGKESVLNFYSDIFMLITDIIQ